MAEQKLTCEKPNARAYTYVPTLIRESHPLTENLTSIQCLSQVLTILSSHFDVSNRFTWACILVVLDSLDSITGLSGITDTQTRRINSEN